MVAVGCGWVWGQFGCLDVLAGLFGLIFFVVYLVFCFLRVFAQSSKKKEKKSVLYLLALGTSFLI